MHFFGRRNANDQEQLVDGEGDRVQLVEGEAGESDGNRNTLTQRTVACLRGHKRFLLFLLAVTLIVIGNGIAIYYVHFR